MDMVMDRMICYDEATKKHLGSVKNKKVKKGGKDMKKKIVSCLLAATTVAGMVVGWGDSKEEASSHRRGSHRRGNNRN